MTTQILSAELNNLVQESKRKNADLRSAAEKSLQELKSLHATSEAQLAADLHRRPQFINPFVVACNTRNPRFAGPAVACFQRLTVIRALPKERLKEVLDAFKECSTLNLDIQLKILQALPSLLYNYADELRGELLSAVLQVCSTLQNVKNPAVSNTAAATLQQLVISIFDKVTSEDQKALEVPTVSEVPGEDGQIPVRQAALDAYRMFNDLCKLIAEGKSQSGRFPHLPPTAALELIEAILSNHGRIFLTHPEQANIVRKTLMPFIIKSLPEKLGFQLFLRIVRVTSILIRQYLDVVSAEAEDALHLLNQMLDPEEAVSWKRALGMEVFRGIYAEPGLILRLHLLYDGADGKKEILRENLSLFVRISTEKPTLIGLGPQSSVPVSSPSQGDSTAEQAALEAGGVAGVISGGYNSSNKTDLHGISSQWSTMRTACMDHLDKAEPPSIPETYIYGLVLNCINSLTDNLAKFILPLTVHPESRRKRARGVMSPGINTPTSEVPESPSTRIARSQSFRKRTVPVNPLTLENHSSYDYIQAASGLITDCWPAVLATCSTFLCAALDSDYYRPLVRSYQKFTQVAGLLRLSTARDALLTTLGKSAVPSNVLTANLSSATGPSESPSLFGNTKGLLSVESLVSQSSADRSRRPSGAADDAAPALGTRNLLCLRALLNLAIALGPTLEQAWSIIFETLQQADIVMAATSVRPGRDRGAAAAGIRVEDGAQSLSSEVAAVQAAASRLFESTTDFPNESFIHVLNALCSLLHTKPSTSNATPTASNPRLSVSTPPLLHHTRRVSSYSGTPVVGVNDEQVQDYLFALGKIGDLANLNMSRLTTFASADSGWDVLTKELIAISCDASLGNTARLMSADIIRRIVRDAAAESMVLDPDTCNQVQRRSLLALQDTIRTLYAKKGNDEDSDLEVHGIALEALKAILERCGEDLKAGWSSVFAVIVSVFDTTELPSIRGVEINNDPSEDDDDMKQAIFKVVSMKLGRSAFESVELICSDFLTAIPTENILTLVDILYRFCSQADDLNISLTTITFFWNVSDFLHARIDTTSLSKLAARVTESPTIFIEVEDAAKDNSIPALWLHALLRLTTVSTDMRAEVRHGAIHTILRIFDNYGDHLSPDSWTVCIRAVMYRMTAMNIQRQHLSRKQAGSINQEQLKSWHETTEIILEGLSSLYANYLDTITQSRIFQELWQIMTQFFVSYLSRGSHEVNAAIYNSISVILSKINDSSKVGSSAVDQIANLWMDHFPTAVTPATKGHGNQDAFVAYIKCFKDVYRLIAKTITASSIERICANFLRSVKDSDAAAYSSDLDHLTPLQAQIIDVLGLIRTDIPTVPTTLVTLLSDIIVLPYAPKSGATQSSKSTLTFGALSKHTMPILQSTILAHISSSELYQPPAALPLAFRSLAVPVSRKYLSKASGKPPPAWQTATSTALALAGPALKTFPTLNLPNNLTVPIWDALVTLATHIIHAPTASAPKGAPLAADEAFDLQAFAQLHRLLVPGLGAAYIPDSTRKRYAAALFSASLVHPPAPGELVIGSLPTESASLAGIATAGTVQPPSAAEQDFTKEKDKDDLAVSPLEGLFSVRHGRTFDKASVMRERIAYACLDEMMALVEARDPSSTSPSDVKTPTRTSFNPADSSEESDTSSTSEDEDEKTSNSVSGLEEPTASLIRLARATSPYLITRSALPLKSYIADQPLRGRLPQPASKRTELLYILQRLRKLRAEPRAIPDAPGVRGAKRSKHLHRLFPLVSRAVLVAGERRGGDKEVLEELGRWVGGVGRGFGVG